MEHISDYIIHSFRGLRGLKIEKLGQINLLVGNNNSGKTSVLEATSIFCDPFNWRRWLDTGSQREATSTIRSTTVDRLIWIFPQTIDSDENLPSEIAKIQISARGRLPVEEITASYEKFIEMINTQRPSLKLEESIEDREIEVESVKVYVTATLRDMQLTLFDDSLSPQETLTFSNRPVIPYTSSKQRIYSLPVQMVNPLSHRTSGLTSRLWSDVVEADLKPETIELLRFFDSAIEDVDFIAPTENRQLISIKHKKLGRVPLHTFGDGLRRVFTLATTIPRVRGGMLLIDELETAIHTKALEKTFDWLVNACIRNDVQLIATTHSLEALDALLDASIDESANLVVYRLQQEQQQTTATRFDKEMTRRLREELGMELRF